MDHILQQPGVKLTDDGKAYEIEFLNRLYLVDPFVQAIREIRPEPRRMLTEEFQILLIRYLVAPYGGPPTGQLISEKDLPGGVTFFQGPHALHVSPIIQKYGRDPDAFRSRAIELGATPVEYGDTAMKFRPFPEMPVTYVLWGEDDEFPASVKVIFDGSISKWFELDMIFMVVFSLTERVIGHW